MQDGSYSSFFKSNLVMNHPMTGCLWRFLENPHLNISSTFKRERGYLYFNQVMSIESVILLVLRIWDELAISADTFIPQSNLRYELNTTWLYFTGHLYYSPFKICSHRGLSEFGTLSLLNLKVLNDDPLTTMVDTVVKQQCSKF